MVNCNKTDVLPALMELIDVTHLSEFEDWNNHHLQRIVPHQFALLATLDTASTNRIIVRKSLSFSNKNEYCSSILGKEGTVSCPILDEWVVKYLNLHEESSSRYKKCSNLAGVSVCNNNITHCYRCVSGSLCSFISLYGFPEDNRDSYKKILKLLVPHVHQALCRLPSERLPQTNMRKQFTTREGEVVKWITHGKTNWEISEILEISEKTVKTHVQNLLSKFEVNTRSQLVGLSQNFR